MATLARRDAFQLGRETTLPSSRVRRTRSLPTSVLARGWQKIGWQSGRKRGDDEGEEAEDAERVRPGCVRNGEEADSGDEARNREPRQQAGCEGSAPST